MRVVLSSFEAPSLVPEVTMRLLVVWVATDGYENLVRFAPGFDQTLLLFIIEVQWDGS